MRNAEVSLTPRRLFQVSAVLWAIWGAVHIFAGAITLYLLLTGKPAEAVQGIASKVDLETLRVDYPAPVSALLCQHGYNLLWFGLATAIAAPFVWRGSGWAVVIASLVGGLADLGYFAFIDLGGYATAPGPQMTWICAAAIATGVVATRLQSPNEPLAAALETPIR